MPISPFTLLNHELIKAGVKRKMGEVTGSSWMKVVSRAYAELTPQKLEELKQRAAVYEDPTRPMYLNLPSDSVGTTKAKLRPQSTALVSTEKKLVEVYRQMSNSNSNRTSSPKGTPTKTELSRTAALAAARASIPTTLAIIGGSRVVEVPKPGTGYLYKPLPSHVENRAIAMGLPLAFVRHVYDSTAPHAKTSARLYAIASRLKIKPPPFAEVKRRLKEVTVHERQKRECIEKLLKERKAVILGKTALSSNTKPKILKLKKKVKSATKKSKKTGKKIECVVF